MRISITNSNTNSNTYKIINHYHSVWQSKLQTSVQARRGKYGLGRRNNIFGGCNAVKP